MGLPDRDLSNATNRPQRPPAVSSRHFWGTSNRGVPQHCRDVRISPPNVPEVDNVAVELLELDSVMATRVSASDEAGVHGVDKRAVA